MRKLCSRSILGGAGERGLTAVNPLAGFCLLKQCPSHRELFGKVVPSLLTPPPGFKTQERPTCTLEIAEDLPACRSEDGNPGAEVQPWSPLWGAPSGPPRAGHPCPAASAPASCTAPRRSLLRRHRVPLVSGFYSRREAESFSPHVTRSAQPRTPRADTGGSGQLHAPSPAPYSPHFALI